MLKRAKRARVSFEGEDVTKASSLIIDTELVRYKWVSVNGNYPEYEKLIPTEFNCFASFDTVEAIKAISSLKVLANAKAYPIDIRVDDSGIMFANTEDKGQAFIPADATGEVKVRVDGGYLAEALRACGGMVEFKVTTPLSPMLFSSNGYQLVVMPMITDEAKKAQQAVTEPEAEPEATEIYEVRDETGKVPEPVSPVADKPKKAQRSRAKQPVTAE